MFEDMKLGLYWMGDAKLSIYGTGDTGKPYFEVRGKLLHYSLGGTEVEEVPEGDQNLDFRMYLGSDQEVKWRLRTLDDTGWNQNIDSPEFTGKAASTGFWVELEENDYKGSISRRWNIWTPRGSKVGEAVQKKDLNRLKSLVAARKRQNPNPNPNPTPPVEGLPAGVPMPSA